MHFEIVEREKSIVANFKGKLMGGGDWRWRLKSENGEIIAQGDGYATRSQCEKAVAQLKQEVASAPINVL